jgi:hypothetical protein
MNVDIGTKATQFPEKKYINGIFLAVQARTFHIYLLLFYTFCSPFLF